MSDSNPPSIQPQPDVLIANRRSVFLLKPLTDERLSTRRPTSLTERGGGRYPPRQHDEQRHRRCGNLAPDEPARRCHWQPRQHVGRVSAKEAAMLDSFKVSSSSPPRRFKGYFPGQITPPDTQSEAPPADCVVTNHGSICLLAPKTELAKTWVDKHLPADRQDWCGAVVVEPRYLADIVMGATMDGLRVA